MGSDIDDEMHYGKVSTKSCELFNLGILTKPL